LQARADGRDTQDDFPLLGEADVPVLPHVRGAAEVHVLNHELVLVREG
jgi:hypothetical protein